jgi:hypothetical protein
MQLSLKRLEGAILVKTVCRVFFAFVVACMFAAGAEPSDAGWFHKKRCECCCGTGCEKCERPCCLKPLAPPRVGVVDALPARITSQRADRVAPAPAAPAPAPAVPPVPAASCSGSSNDAELAKRMTQLEQDLRTLKEAVSLLTP